MLWGSTLPSDITSKIVYGIIFIVIGLAIILAYWDFIVGLGLFSILIIALIIYRFIINE